MAKVKQTELRCSHVYAAGVIGTQAGLRNMHVYAAEFAAIHEDMRCTYVYAAASRGGSLLRWLSAFQQGHLLILKGPAPLIKLLQSQVASSSGCKLSHSLG